jgi:acyl-homoserine-lactone acylase
MNITRSYRLSIGFICLLPFLSHGGEENLATQALIRRDIYGVPHIVASSEAAAAFAHGHATAEDHLPGLARGFLRARGEEAAQFGEAYLASDFRNQEFRIYEAARDYFHKLPPLSQAIYDGYAAGYNLFLSQHRQKAPEWATLITGIDVLAHCRLVLLLDFSVYWRVWEKLDDSFKKGSNAWAIGRELSSSGHGILLANPHLPWEGSHLFHEAHIYVPNRINVSGAALVGFPFIGIGFNENLGWSLTVNQCASQDIYELKLDPRDSTRYLYEGQSLPLISRTLKVEVRTSSGREIRTKNVWSSHQGPVIRIGSDKAYALKSANLEQLNFLTQWNMMAKAKSLSEFRAALNIQGIPMFNIAYADRDGNTFYLYNCRTPIRPQGYNWRAAIPGDSSNTEWYAIYPIAELPQLTNPKGGYVQNANNAPWYTNLKDPIDSRKFPGYFIDEGLDLRGQISLQMLEGYQKVTVEQVKADKHNEKLLLAERIKPSLLEIARGRTLDGIDLTPAVEVLKTWDNRAGADSVGAVLFYVWWNEYKFSTKRWFASPWNSQEPLSTPRGIGDPLRALQALAKAVRDVTQQYGSISVSWGTVFRFRRGSLDLPIGGAPNETGAFRTISYRRDKDGKWRGIAGDSYVLAVEFTNPPKAYSILAYSQSGDSASKHFNDQAELFSTGKFKNAWFTEKEIQDHLERVYHPGETR